MGEKKQDNVAQVSFLSAFSIWLCCALFYIYQYGARSSFPNLLTQEYMAFFKIDASEVGMLASGLYIMYSLMQIPAGILLDNFPLRKVGTVVCLCCAIGMTVLSLTTSYTIAFLSQFLTGTGAAFAVLLLFKVANTFFDKKYVPMFPSFSLGVGAFGAMFLGYTLASVLKMFEWRDVLFYFALSGYVIAFILWMKIPEEKEEKNDAPKVNLVKTLKKNLLYIVTSKQIWVMFLITFLWHAPMVAIADLWGATFLITTYPGISDATALSISNLIYLGFAVGLVSIISIAYMLKSFKKPMYLAASLMSVAFAVVIYCPGLSISTMSILFFIVGFSCGGLLTYNALLTIVPANISGTASSFINTGGMLCGVFLQPLIGKFITNAAVIENGVAKYTFETFQSGFLIILVFMIAILVFIPFMNETFPVDNKE